MYPWVRIFKEFLKFRKAPKLSPFDTHVSQHRCWPTDIDPWLELNNGRVLTLFDLGRMPMAMRTGVLAASKKNGWVVAVAGASVRYRRRVKLFDKIEMRSRMAGWDHRFVYMDQSMWVGGECTSQALLRCSITRGARGLVDPAEMARALGLPPESPPLPAWVSAWIEADGTRPWPPSFPDHAPAR